MKRVDGSAGSVVSRSLPELRNELAGVSHLPLGYVICLRRSTPKVLSRR